MDRNYLGYEATNTEIEKDLKSLKINYKKIEDPQFTPKQLSNGKIIGWFQGANEFGDRALGNRSILADPEEKILKTK